MTGYEIYGIEHLRAFIVRAKAATYVGSGARTESSRTGSHDLRYDEGRFSYLDSYFGGADFIGQEVVYYENQPIWAMNYYGRILMPELITAAQAGQVIKTSLSSMYTDDRFLGGFLHESGEFSYHDTNQGDVRSFQGTEWITTDDQRVYELVYHGGLIKD